MDKSFFFINFCNTHILKALKHYNIDDYPLHEDMVKIHLRINQVFFAAISSAIVEAPDLEIIARSAL